MKTVGLPLRFLSDGEICAESVQVKSPSGQLFGRSWPNYSESSLLFDNYYANSSPLDEQFKMTIELINRT